MVALRNASRAPGDGSRPSAAIIIGAGFAGIGMAIALKKRGMHDFLILEKGGDVGGVA
jgi:cation diffusion facilitator CzcD-associated flavoprotein CzcO